MSQLFGALVLPALLAGGGPGDGTLYVSGYAPNAVFRYDAVPGTFIDRLDPAGGIAGPLGVTLGPDGRVYVASEITDHVPRFDAATGAFVDDFIATGTGELTEPAAVVFGPDQTDDGAMDFYVSSFNGDSVLLFDGASGAFVETFVAPSSGGLNGPDAGMTFGPDGNLYVPSYWSNRVLRYDGATGAFIDIFVPAGSGGLQRPRTLLFRPDGNLLVTCEASDRVNLYDGTTGAFLQTVIVLDSPTGMDMDANGWLYVASIGNSTVGRYQPDYTFDTIVVDSGEGGMTIPTFVMIDEACPADLDGDGEVAFSDLLAMLAAWGPCAGCAEDIDDDGLVGFTDLLALLAAWGPCP